MNLKSLRNGERQIKWKFNAADQEGLLYRRGICWWPDLLGDGVDVPANSSHGCRSFSGENQSVELRQVADL